MRKIPIYILMLALLGACATRQREQNTLYVSILPLRSVVGSIVGDDFRIGVLVPPGASPETFEPTPRQFIGVNEARMLFSVGLIDFENALISKVERTEKVVDLSRGIDLLAGSCAHDHGNGSHDNGNSHANGNTAIDPHIWTSPRALLQMAENAYNAIHAAYPDSVKYTANYQRFVAQLQALDRRTGEKIAQSGIEYFIIYHPALTYYARDYGIRQVAIEEDGKEPSARQLTQIIRQARADGVHRILYQSQFPASAVEVIARDIDAEYVEIDPLGEDVIATIDRITDMIVRK